MDRQVKSILWVFLIGSAVLVSAIGVSLIGIETTIRDTRAFHLEFVLLCGLLVASVFCCSLAGVWIWGQSKFSIRDLLIATTLVAVVLGLGVWLVR